MHRTFRHMDTGSSMMLRVCLRMRLFQFLSCKERPPAAVFQWPHALIKALKVLRSDFCIKTYTSRRCLVNRKTVIRWPRPLCWENKTQGVFAAYSQDIPPLFVYSNTFRSFRFKVQNYAKLLGTKGGPSWHLYAI